MKINYIYMYNIYICIYIYNYMYILYTVNIYISSAIDHSYFMVLVICILMIHVRYICISPRETEFASHQQKFLDLKWRVD